MHRPSHLVALAAVAALGLIASACASRQTTTDSQTATGPGLSQPGTPAMTERSTPGVTTQPGQDATPGVASRNVPGDPYGTPGGGAAASRPGGSQPGASLTLSTPGGPVTLTDVFFDFDESTLSPAARGVLEQNAEYLRRNPQARIQIEGHADERGSTSYNLALGDRRATATKRYIESLGVDAGRVSTISFGEEKPFALGQTEEAWAQNRRGHFVEVK